MLQNRHWVIIGIILMVTVLLVGVTQAGQAKVSYTMAESVSLTGVAQISAGSQHTCTLITGGAVKCSGSNSDGQLGDGTTTDRLTPTTVSGLSNGVTTIASGTRYTCALTTQGGVKCWGWNGNGQLGDGTTTQRLTPVNVVGLNSGVQAISIGVAHSCALTTQGGVKCWGSNGGRLGDGTTTQRLTPVDVVGLNSGIQAISAGRFHSCALTTQGGVKCWGWNNNGELGDGTQSYFRLTPVDVVGLNSGIQAISAGDDHTCALTTQGGVKCWGNNSSGQLGDSTMVSKSTPVDVLIDGSATPVPTATPTITLTPTPSPTGDVLGITSYHSGFDPNKDAYPFINDDARNSWDTFVRTYGNFAFTPPGVYYFSDQYTRCVRSYKHCQGEGSGGVCGGMAATEALAFRGMLDLNSELGISKPKDAAEPAKRPFSLFVQEDYWDRTPVSDFLVVYQGKQQTQEFDHERDLAKGRSLTDTVQLLKLSLQGDALPYFIGLEGAGVNKGECIGHALMPTGWEGNENYTAFTVVDPNDPKKESKVITATLTTGEWVADMSASEWGIWKSKNTCTKGRNITPNRFLALSAVVLRDAHSPYWKLTDSDPARSAQIPNKAHLFVSESVTATVHSVAEFYIPFGPTRGSTGNYPQHYTYNAGEDMQATLLYSDTTSFVQVVEPGAILAVEGSGSISSQDQINMNGRQGEIAVTAGSQGKRTLTSVTDSRQYDLAHIGLYAGSSISAVFASNSVTVTASVDQPAYTLHVNYAGITGTVEYTLTMPVLEAGSTHHLTPDSTQQLVVVETDENSDGVIDDEVVVKPIDTLPVDTRLYLPIIIR